ncbi:MAG TPA: Hsp20/alpha crystallin family protein [Vicinamibacteria bacterium]|nr:Hsp20/alpha crystallin family protein [Vicinamibacteria bacterium]
MVQRHETLSEVTSLQKEINKIFEQMARLERTESGGMSLGEWLPRVDVFETRGSVVVKVEAPGFSKNDLSVTFRGPKMILTGEKKQPKSGRSVQGYLCLERSFGKFTRSLYIDRAVDLTQAKAELSEGILTVTMPTLKDRRGSEFRLTIVDGEAKTRTK